MSTGKRKGSERFFTTGQVAKTLRISVSTLKRWLINDTPILQIKHNVNGWKLFSEKDIELLKDHRKLKKKLGKKYNSSTLKPISQD